MDFIYVFCMVDGVIKLIFACVLASFLLLQACRKTKLARLSWVGLILINFITFISAFYMLELSNSSSNVSNCSYSVSLIYGIENLIVFNLTAYIGYKVYLVVYDMEEFVRTGSLPTKRSLTIRKVLIWVVQALSSFGMILYISLNLVWMFDAPDDTESVQVYALVARLGEMAVYLIISGVYITAVSIMRRLQERSSSINRRKNKQLN
mmetsp:Transcript_22561/g.27892  ORF Transcript_22561/g.27892 Transcript_22561/m.27892 type:complete len:207 (+) Transcript_22561:112-732(+)